MKAADAQAKPAKGEQARAALDAAQLNLSYTGITAPVDGVATHKQVEPGQIVQAGQGLLVVVRSEEHTSELQSHLNLVCRLLLEKKKKIQHALYAAKAHVI